MHPVLFKFGWFSVYSFGFLLAVSFLLAIYLSSRRASRFGVDPQNILDLAVYVILAGVLGSRLLYVVFHLNEYDNLLDIFALWQGGATLYGGLLLAIFAVWAFSKKRGIDYLLLADIIAPSLALGIMLTRVGCFLSGCCYGKPTTLPWGVVFPEGSAAGAYSRQLAAELGVDVVHLHPAQLYASGFGLITFLILMLGEKKFVKRGSTFGSLLILYGIFRFTLDFFRYYEQNMRMIFDLTLNQLVSIGLISFGLFLVFRKTKAETVAVASRAK